MIYSKCYYLKHCKLKAAQLGNGEPNRTFYGNLNSPCTQKYARWQRAALHPLPPSPTPLHPFQIHFWRYAEEHQRHLRKICEVIAIAAQRAKDLGILKTKRKPD